MSSETAHFLILGYDLIDFPGRGYIEAKGKGIPLKDTDVAILCHLCCVENHAGNLWLRWGRPHIADGESEALKRAVEFFESKGMRIRLAPSGGIDGFLVLEGTVSPMTTDSDPIYEGKPVLEVMPLTENRDSSSARDTAAGLNEYLKWCHHILAKHPVNVHRSQRHLPPVNAVVTQRPGQRRKLMPFREKFGLRGLSISSGPIYWGLCTELGMDVARVSDTGNVEEDLKCRLRYAKDARDYDFIHVHTKMPDEAGHAKNPWYKKEVIEAVDRAMSVAVHEIMPERETLLVVTADHSTASSGSMIHTGESVPLTMAGKYVRRDEVGYFNEIACANGALGVVRGNELMYLILNFLDRAKMQGLMDTPVDQPYYPGNFRPLRV
jgi:2,3-bisphosphoglycerate-independent phosphoglycerate mutase